MSALRKHGVVLRKDKGRSAFGYIFRGLATTVFVHDIIYGLNHFISCLSMRDFMYWTDLGAAIIEGIISIPVDLAQGAKRSYEDIAGSPSIRAENRGERERAFRSIKMAIYMGASDSGPIEKMIKIILTKFYDKLPDSMIQTIAEKAGLGVSFMGSRVATQAAITTAVARKITQEVVILGAAKRFVKFGVGVAGSALLIQGLIENASNASKRLQISHPEIYKLFRENDLDMAYFLIEDSMTPIMSALSNYEESPQSFQEAVKRVIDEY